ncbi:MAG: serine--tRNA ligase [Anaerolineae bacterium]|nr:serine--tRNA ligase [Anaerolineae bacterium]MDW8172061.1 serine--tRNA ligase [Anaerolineae bacterium]
MLDIALFREKPDWVREQLAKLNDPTALARVDAVVDIDKRRRAMIQEAEALQATRNRLNKAFGQLRGSRTLSSAQVAARAVGAAEALEVADYVRAEAILSGAQAVDDAQDANPEAALARMNDAMRVLSERHAQLSAQADAADDDLRREMLWIPNLPHESVPVGPDDSHNVPWPVEGAMPSFDFTPKPHWELGVDLDIIDFERGVRLAGSRFYVLKGWGARLQRALATFFLDMARQKGFVELYLPFLVYDDMLEGAGQFPKFTDVVYSDPDADLYLLPTAEVAITNLHRDEILDEAQLPLYYVAQTPCFRREKTSAGRDVRGIKRVHQFEKVEMYKFTTPETSYAELESLVEAACDIARALEIPHRRLEIVTGDLGFSASKKYDVEMWAAGSQEWLEVSSCSNTEAFQARRAMIRYYPKDSKKAQYVHTLNGSGLALPRVIIAILENYQQADGSVVIPSVLRPYLGGETIIRKP